MMIARFVSNLVNFKKIYSFLIETINNFDLGREMREKIHVHNGNPSALVEFS